MQIEEVDKRVCLMATFRPKPGAWKDVEGALIRAIAKVNNERGCLRYELTESQAELLVLTEVWADQQDLDAHNIGLPLQRLNQELENKLAAPVELIFT